MFNIANMITSLNLLSGLTAIYLGIQHHTFAAACLIVIGTCFDALDGFFARLLGLQSKIGAVLDSYADFIVFGMAPIAILLGKFGETSPSFFMSGVLYLLACLYRLIRYHQQQGGYKSYFTGLPITTAGGFLAGLAMLKFPVLSPMFFQVLLITLSFLMVSTIAYPKVSLLIHYWGKKVMSGLGIAALLGLVILPVGFSPTLTFGIYTLFLPRMIKRFAKADSVEVLGNLQKEF